MNIFNVIAFNKLNKICIQDTLHTKQDNKLLISAFNTELFQFGYFLSENVQTNLNFVSIDELTSIYESLINILTEKSLNSITFKPLFKKFPEQYMDLNYLVKRILSVYPDPTANQFNILSCGHYINSDIFDINDFSACPVCNKGSLAFNTENISPSHRICKKFNQIESNLLIEIDLCSKDELLNCVSNIFKSKLAYSQSDRDIVKLTLDKSSPDFISFFNCLPVVIPNKENATYISSLLFSLDLPLLAMNYIKTSTDILRLAVSFSNGDISLANKTKFKLSGKERKFILLLLNDKTRNSLEDLLRFRNHWLALSSYLHIGSYKSKFPNAFSYINTLRNNEKEIETFNRSFELFMKEEQLDVDSLLCLVKTRPGVFARQLDHIIRKTSKDDSLKVINSFKEVINDVSINVLLSLYKHFLSYDELYYRAVFPKGNVLKMKLVEKTKMIDAELVSIIVSLLKTTLSNMFAERGRIDNVYIDPSIYNYIVPFATRTNSNYTRPIVKGSRVKINVDDKDVLRLFIHWFNATPDYNDYEEEEDVDLDLSAMFISEDLENQYFLNFCSGSSLSHFARYSGDRREAPLPHGSSEFIDIDIKKIKEMQTALNFNNLRYVCMCVNVFSNQPFNDFKSYAGVQLLNNDNLTELYDETSLINSFSLVGETNSIKTFIFDFYTNEIIWLDIHHSSQELNIVQSERAQLRDFIEVFKDFEKSKLTMRELLELHMLRFNNVDTEFNPNKNYDLVIDQNFMFNHTEITSNWI